MDTLTIPTARVQGNGGSYAVTCEPTDDPYLAITPEMTPGFSGRFVLTHLPTGRRIGTAACAKCIRDCATNVAELDLDWNFTVQGLPQGASLGEIKEALQPMVDCLSAMGGCDQMLRCPGCGAYRRRTEAGEHGDLWTCINPHCDYDK